MNDILVQIMKGVNYGFLLIFFVEQFFKVILTGFRKYINDGWNIFDLLIVISTFVSVILDNVINETLGTSMSVFRIFRIARFLKLIKNAKGVRMIVHTFISTLP